MIKRLTILMMGICLMGIHLVHGQSDHTGHRRVTGTYAITNATITTQPGKQLSGSTIIIKDGLIQAIGKNETIPVDAKIIEGDSLFIYAGFIDMGSQAGVEKPEEAKKPENFDPSNPPNDVAGITPERSVLDYWDISDGSVGDWRKVGFTIAQLLPKGEMLPGNAALVVYGATESTNVLDESTGLYAQFETVRGVYPGTTLGLMAKYRELYKNAELKDQHAQLFASNTNGISRPEKNKSLEAFYPVINKQVPVIFEAKEELEIRRVLKLQQELGFELVITDLEEGSNLAQELLEANAQVVLSLDLPDDKAAEADLKEATEAAKSAHKRVVEAYNSSLANAGKFEKAGVKFGFSSNHVKQEDALKNLRLMISHGLSEEGALAALTTHPAQILGIDNFAGTIEKGKLANLVIATDSIFSEEAKINYVMADGYLFEYDVTKSKKGNGEAKNLTGKWNYTSETPGGTSSGEIRFSDKSGNLSGEIDVDDPNGGGTITRELENISYNGKDLSFTFSITVQGQKLTVSTKGKVDGADFNGTISIRDMGNFSLTAKKVPDLKF
ncbi:amidohydrolase [Echinicola strongylocentroti]|uniref:Amidohydrolase n=1 Tax=Echinicola strongylocentroti TaxID=1795355 RepID=A0A2Z4IP98_9BACT|nr:amidohydrolase family protein [Echinicola strongylocentroti]AWW32942.1 amidohydrolase [Echinicola strongylocentroti]